MDDPKMRNQIRWKDVHYEPGYLEAIARKDGQIVARHKIETTDEPVSLKAEPDNQQWKADGMDLQHVRIVAVDKKGRRVQTAGQRVEFSLEGDAKIAGVVNGDIYSSELTVGPSRLLYNGTCTVILRAGCTPGKVQLTATADGLKKTVVKLQTTAQQP